MTTQYPVPAAPPAPAVPFLPEQSRPPIGTGAVVAAAIGIAIAALLVLAVLAYLFVGLGVVGVAVSGIAALLPLVVVLLTVRWIDRWEPEPRSALWFAFLWGAGASVVIALIVDLTLSLSTPGGEGLGDFGGSVIQAPVVEEVGKGLGVLLILWVGRRYFDGPVDGLVYAATVAAGFAFTENILYFGSSLLEGGFGELATTFIVRGVFSPFAHIMFTACTGLALGYASRVTGPFGAIGFFLLGLIPAIALHALWNGAFYFVSDVIGYYFAVQVPLFLLAVAIVVALRVHERRLTRQRLAEYAAVGWFTPGEVNLLSTHDGRRRAVAWARSAPAGPGGVSRVRIMKQFLRDSTRLAHTRHRVLRGRGAIGSAPDEQLLLGRITEHRRALLA